MRLGRAAHLLEGGVQLRVQHGVGRDEQAGILQQHVCIGERALRPGECAFALMSVWLRLSPISLNGIWFAFLMMSEMPGLEGIPSCPAAWAVARAFATSPP